MAFKTNMKNHPTISAFFSTLLIFCVLQAQAKDVPFGDANTIDGDFADARSVYAADVDGDGDLDILGAAFDADEIMWWENDGYAGGWAEHTVDDSFNGACSTHAADVDGDGDIDILGAAYYHHDIAWWENTDPNGNGTAWAEHLIDGDVLNATSVYAADIDDDGDLDVLGTAYATDDIFWWENTDPNGNGTTWTKRDVNDNYDHPEFVYSADVDGDGDLDVLGSSRTKDNITWWENTAGDGTDWSEHIVDDFFDGAGSVRAADVDRDGDLDVVSAAQFANDVTWWENIDGGGNSWTEHTLDDNFTGAISVLVADLDYDGDMDVVGAAKESNTIAWWEKESPVIVGNLDDDCDVDFADFAILADNWLAGTE